MCSKLVKQVRAAHRCSVPLVAIETPDPAATISSIVSGVDVEGPKIAWDAIRGFHPCNEAGSAVMSDVGDQCVGAVLEMLKRLNNLREDVMVFFHLASELVEKVPTTQAVWNLRDVFKSKGNMLVMLGPDFGNIPAELRHDVIVLDEPLPDDEQLSQIVDDLLEVGNKGEKLEVADDVKAKAIDAIRGLSAFEAEQVFAMSINGDGVDLDACWERKRKAVEQTKGLSVFRGKSKFDSLAGLEPVKKYFTRLMNGPLRPNVVVWLDEIEKSGLAHETDLSGVNADQLGTVLSYMEDKKVMGTMLVGVPGGGKSEFCKCLAGEFAVPVIRMDMGAMQGSLVGESQQNLRQALKVVDAVGGSNCVFIATSNSIQNLDDALKNRFTKTFFFDLPSKEQRVGMWDIHVKPYGLDKHDVNDDGWCGRNVQRCCEEAYKLGISIAEAAEAVIPVAIESAEQIKRLRANATGKYLSADYPGVYTMPGDKSDAPTKRRAFRE